MTHLTVLTGSQNNFLGRLNFIRKNKSEPNCHSVDTSDVAVIGSTNAITKLKREISIGL